MLIGGHSGMLLVVSHGNSTKCLVEYLTKKCSRNFKISWEPSSVPWGIFFYCTFLQRRLTSFEGLVESKKESKTSNCHLSLSQIFGYHNQTVSEFEPWLSGEATIHYWYCCDSMYNCKLCLSMLSNSILNFPSN